MIVSGEAIEWLTSFSIVNLMLGGLLFKHFKTFMNLVPFQEQLECYQYILNKI